MDLFRSVTGARIVVILGILMPLGAGCPPDKKPDEQPGV
jgi:hypothetical protein